MNNSIVNALKNTCDSYLNNMVSQEMLISFLESSLNILRQNNDNNTDTNDRSQEVNQESNNDSLENTSRPTQESSNNDSQENTSRPAQETTSIVQESANNDSQDAGNTTQQDGQDQQGVQSNQIQVTIMVTRPENVFTNNINI